MKEHDLTLTKKYDAYELRCYNDIMDFFLIEHRDTLEVELWRDLKLIELMNELKNDRALKLIITKAIIILNALSHNYPSDTSNHVLNEPKEMTLEEKQDFRDSLIKELSIS